MAARPGGEFMSYDYTFGASVEVCQALLRREWREAYAEELELELELDALTLFAFENEGGFRPAAGVDFATSAGYDDGAGDDEILRALQAVWSLLAEGEPVALIAEDGLVFRRLPGQDLEFVEPEGVWAQALGASR